VKFVISSGHGLHVRGASGYLDEVDEARRVVDRVAAHLRELENQVDVFHDNSSQSQDENLQAIVDFHNGCGERDLDISIHFNAFETTSEPMGTEVLYVSQEAVAAELSEAIAEAGDFIDRGAKYRGDLYFLNQTNEPAILVETCFVDSARDAELYHAHFADICIAIAERLAGEEIVDMPNPPELPERPAEPPLLTEENVVEIDGIPHGDVMIVVNGERVHGDPQCQNVVDLRIRMKGDVVLVLNGQDFHNIPEAK
jgi:hypothetical protein